MADLQTQKDIASLVSERALSSSLSWTAAGASDNVTWTGLVIDRGSFNGSWPHTVDVLVVYDATLAATKSLSFTFDLQDSADGTNFSDYVTEAATIAVTSTAGGKVVGVAHLQTVDANGPGGVKKGVSLGGARRYLRLLLVPDLSNTATDTGVIATVGVFAGGNSLPAPL